MSTLGGHMILDVLNAHAYIYFRINGSTRMMSVKISSFISNILIYTRRFDTTMVSSSGVSQTLSFMYLKMKKYIK